MVSAAVGSPKAACQSQMGSCLAAVVGVVDHSPPRPAVPDRHVKRIHHRLLPLRAGQSVTLAGIDLVLSHAP